MNDRVGRLEGRKFEVARSQVRKFVVRRLKSQAQMVDGGLDQSNFAVQLVEIGELGG